MTANRYIAGYNQPGYLPESDPAEFATFEEAKRYIIDELKWGEECYGYSTLASDEAIAESLCHLAEDVNLESGPFSAQAADGYIYWVELAD